MKTVASILALTTALVAAVPASAGDRGHSEAYRTYMNHRGGEHHHSVRHRNHDLRREHPRHRHYRPLKHHHHHHHYSGHRHRTHKGEYFVGGVMLGVLLNELASDRRPVATRTTTYVVSEPVPRSTRQYMEEYLLDSDGRCYAVDYRGDARVLTEVDSINCR